MDWNKASELVGQAQSILVLTHVRPDGDAIGSMTGLTHALRGMGKEVCMAVDGGVPAPLAFLPGSNEVSAQLDNVAVDLVIAVDCGDESRMGQVGQVARRNGTPLVNLDHHRTNTMFGDANLVDAETVAAAEGVLDWLDYMEIVPDPTVAFCLLTGIVTDTLCFRTDNVRDATLGKAQRLMGAGASLIEIVQRTVSRSTYAGLRLLKEVLPSVNLENHVIWAVITSETYTAAEYPGTDDAGLVSTLVEIEEAYISAVFKARNDGGIELGLRAVPGFDVSEVALAFGGGGHKLASGATIYDVPLETLVPRVVEMLKAEAQKGQPLVK